MAKRKHKQRDESWKKNFLVSIPKRLSLTEKKRLDEKVRTPEEIKSGRDNKTGMFNKYNKANQEYINSVKTNKDKKMEHNNSIKVGKEIKKAFEEFLKGNLEKGELDKIFQKLIDMAKNGDLRAIQEVLDRSIGKEGINIDVTSQGDKISFTLAPEINADKDIEEDTTTEEVKE